MASVTDGYRFVKSYSFELALTTLKRTHGFVYSCVHFFTQTTKWQTRFSSNSSKRFTQRLPMASIQTQSWMRCFQRMSFVPMTTKDFVKFQLPEIVVEICCLCSMRHHILRRSFIFVSLCSLSTRGSLMRSMTIYHH